jgi:outer membrane receptor for ferrienterochelin and colicin
MNYWLSPKDRFYLSLYVGHDKTKTSIEYQQTNTQPNLKERIKQETSNLVKWGNSLMAARWNHIWSPKLFSNVTATYGFYNYKLHSDHRFSYEEEFSRRISVAGYTWRFNSGIQDIGLKWDFDFYPHPRHEVKFGAGSLYHRFQPGFAKISFLSNFDRFEDFQYQANSTLIQSLESHIYVEDQWKIHENVRLQAGLHAVHYREGKKTYPSLQPRFSVLWRLRDNIQMKLAYASMAQYVHLLSNPGVDLPSDRWVPATESIPPQSSQQLSFGTWWQPGNKGISIGVEAYYKKLKNLITYQSSEDFYNQVVKWQSFVEKNGTGEAYGVEFLARKSKGKTTGWVGYTLSWNYRQFENLNGGKPFPFRYDRRHDINIALIHQLSDRVGLSANWVYGTGNAITLTTGFHNSWMQDIGQVSPFNLGGLVGIPSEERNGIRMGNYHRLDVAIQLTKKTSWGERSWHFGLFNAYNRNNPYYYYYQVGLGQNANGQMVPELNLMQYSLFGMLPAISYHFSF